ncbi:MAG: group I intron-associated PD-(D/E)XK endonuclease [Minisyncoccia bacterium]
MKTKEKGDLAVANAIRYYVTCGYEVCLPIGDKKDYDFVVEKNNILHRVQVKFAGIYSDDKCKVGLRITGGNQSFNYSKKYNLNSFDFLFVYTERGEMYSIPWKEVDCRNEITIDNIKYQKYKKKV